MQSLYYTVYTIQGTHTNSRPSYRPGCYNKFRLLLCCHQTKPPAITFHYRSLFSEFGRPSTATAASFLSPLNFANWIRLDRSIDRDRSERQFLSKVKVQCDGKYRRRTIATIYRGPKSDGSPPPPPPHPPTAVLIYGGLGQVCCAVLCLCPFI